MWSKIIVSTIVVLSTVIAGAILYGTQQWQSETRELHAKMETAHVPGIPRVYDPRELAGLPAPVQRYFATVLQEGQPLVTAARVEHAGTFNMGRTEEQWKPFQSTQQIRTRRPGFVWDARIQMAPAMTARVRDAYVAGDGLLTAKLFGLVTVMEMPSTPELAQGELMRFLAESAWYPTALLPSQGVVWDAIDDTRASATLTDGTTTVTLVFQFDDQGLISGVSSEGRCREVDGRQVATPWQGRFWDYTPYDGMLVPQEGEVAWLLEKEQQPYWRGRIQQIEYTYAR